MDDMKFPSIQHFPWSENLRNDDTMLPSIECFDNKEIVVLLKLDGENTGMTKDKCHARSEDSKDHPSRHWVKGLHAQIKNDLGNLKIFGENCYAEHSIFYPELTTYFYVFAIWDGDICLSWDKTAEIANLLNLQVVPVLYRGLFNVNNIKSCYNSNIKYFGAEMEGYVVRNVDSFKLDEFQNNYGKMVRKNHVQTGETSFWMNHWKPNKIVV